MPVDFRTLSNAITTLSTVTVTKPTGTVDGDLLIVAMGTDGNQEVNSVPAGWTLINTAEGDSNLQLFTYYKIASSEGASWDWGWDGSGEDKQWVALRFDGQDAVAINTDAIAVSSNNESPQWANTITPTYTDCMLVMIILCGQADAGGVSDYGIATSSPTWTERLDTTTNDVTLAVATGTRPEVTATGVSTAELVTAGSVIVDSICSIIAINRVHSFASSLTDTVNSTDTVGVVIQKIVSVNDAVSITDSGGITAVDDAVVTNTPKSSSTWLNPDKS